MSIVEIACIVLGLAIGIFIGMFMFAFYMVSITYGQLRIADANDGDDPYLYLELDKKPTDITDRKYVVFRVNPNKITPRE